MNYDFHIGTIADVLKVDSQIPEFDGRNTAEKIMKKLADKNALMLIASFNKKPVAYKIGYELSQTEFYSWLGGVSSDHRKQGIATQLRKKQERWAADKGYESISVKSMNRFPAMLQMLIGSGYQISGYQDNGSAANSKICFIKHLKEAL
ncbi:GNAT family N-acetyltransferase [Psychromonas ossibalaenae]|uniref:GNAT family N-acetyltransferase n=1 Tax=Psychromonas ossibalaenae TaxID=444922 RepID=UPI000365EAD1|nr:GNAT family N-acetyltransferase [Psychromonas ossibalaenae]